MPSISGNWLFCFSQAGVSRSCEITEIAQPPIVRAKLTHMHCGDPLPKQLLSDAAAKLIGEPNMAFF